MCLNQLLTIFLPTVGALKCGVIMEGKAFVSMNNDI